MPVLCQNFYRIQKCFKSFYSVKSTRKQYNGLVINFFTNIAELIKVNSCIHYFIFTANIHTIFFSDFF